MYQTIIASTDGRTAIDTAGRTLYVAGSAPVMAGKMVWTDGRIIYGNILSGGSPFIPVSRTSLFYAKHDGTLWSLDGTRAKALGTARGMLIGGDGHCAALASGKGYEEKEQLVAGEYTIAAAYTADGDVVSVRADPEDFMTRYYNNHNLWKKDIPLFQSFRKKFPKNLIDGGPGNEYCLGEQKMLLRIIRNGAEIGRISIDYGEEYRADMESRLSHLESIDGGNVSVGDCTVSDDRIVLIMVASAIGRNASYRSKSTWGYYRCEYDLSGSKVSMKKLTSDNDHAVQAYSMVVDGFEVEYRKTSEILNEMYLQFCPVIKVDEDTVWELPAGVYVESICHHKGLVYAVVRNAGMVMRDYDHAVAVFDGKSASMPQELKEMMIYEHDIGYADVVSTYTMGTGYEWSYISDDNILYRCVPSTMGLPRLKSSREVIL